MGHVGIEIMSEKKCTRLSIKEASEKFQLSPARIYKLLADGKIKGERAGKRGRGGGSWVDAGSLSEHIECRHENLKHGKGGLKIPNEGHYMPVSEAAKKAGYTVNYIHRLTRQGSIGTRKSLNGDWRLVDYRDLLRHKNFLKKKDIVFC